MLKSCLNYSDLYIKETDAYEHLGDECKKITQDIWKEIPELPLSDNNAHEA